MTSKIGRSPSYLVRNPYTYCFRMNVPKDLQRYVCKKELRYSLRTGYLGLAKQKARLLAGNIQYLFRYLRDKGNIMSKLTDYQIQTIVNTYIREKLQSVEEDRAKNEFTPITELEEMAEGIEDSVSDAMMDLQQAQYGTASYTVNNLLRKEKIPLEHDDLEFNKICRELLKAEIKYYKVELNRLAGDYSDDINVMFSVPTESSQQKSSPILLKNLIEEYTKRKIELNKWRPNTVRNHQAKINTMLQVLGNKPVNQITKNDARRLAKLLELLPPGFSNMKKYKDISSVSPKDLKGKHDKTLDVSTRRDYLIFARQIFSFAEESDYIIKNPIISGIVPDKKNNPRDLRYPFDDPEDLARIFNAELFLEWSKDHPSRFWIPLLALYTGCRLEEMASLYCEDVFEYKRLWCIEINNNHDKMVKTPNAIRSIPLHSILVDQLRFPQYVNRVKAQGNDRVFPDLKKENYKYGHGLSKRFGYYLRKKAKITDNKKTFHSFRHNVTDYLMRNLVKESLVEELNGRSGKTESSRTYFKGHRSDVLYKKCIAKLEYKVDLTHLKNSKYVIKD